MLTGCQLLVLEVDLVTDHESTSAIRARKMLQREVACHLLEPERNYIGTFGTAECVLEEFEVVHRADQVVRSRGVNVPRHAQRSDRSERAKVGLTQMELVVCRCRPKDENGSIPRKYRDLRRVDSPSQSSRKKPSHSDSSSAVALATCRISSCMHRK